MIRKVSPQPAFKAVYKGYLVRVTPDERQEEFHIVFYTASTSTKHEITLSAQEFLKSQDMRRDLGR